MLRLAVRRLAAIAALSVLAACKDANEPDPDPVEEFPYGVLVASRADSVITMELDGTERHSYVVPHVGQYGQHPTWSGSSAVLVHTQAAAAGPSVRIHRLDLATGGLTRLTPTTSPLAHEWYPYATGSSWVWFMGETSSGTFEMWRMRPNGTEMSKRPATTPAYGNYYRPVLSPDLSRVAVSTVQGATIGVQVFDATTGASVSPWVAGRTAPRWSPDGSQVASSTPGGGVIHVMNANGSGDRPISQAGFHEWFDWMPDGQSIVASDASGLKLVKVADGAVQPIANTAGMWQPSILRAVIF